MTRPVPALAAAALLLAAASAHAEPDDVRLSHPADTSVPYPPPAEIEPFDLAVPLLNRAMPSPSYAPSSSSAATPADEPDAAAMPEMDHGGMDHSGMSH